MIRSGGRCIAVEQTCRERWPGRARNLHIWQPLLDAKVTSDHSRPAHHPDQTPLG